LKRGFEENITDFSFKFRAGAPLGTGNAGAETRQEAIQNFAEQNLLY
jgi:hypothetical protein